MSRTLVTELVDTVEQCQAAVAQLLLEQEVVVDIEGVQLGRGGEICLIQVLGAAHPTVYLFDIHTLKRDAFVEGGLQRLLEAENIRKLLFDVRSDADALHHTYGVSLQPAYDVQILWHLKFQHPEDRYLQGLKLVQGKFLEESKKFTPRSKERIDQLKETGVRLFAPELGGSYDVWKQRPLCPELVDYAAVDVQYLLDMRDHWAPRDGTSAELDAVVTHLTSERLRAFVELPDAFALDQSQKKFRDFALPDGFNSTGDVVDKVPVPKEKRGLVIGTKGATRQAIQESTGTKITLDDDNPDALVFGQPKQVEAAIKRIQDIISRRR